MSFIRDLHAVFSRTRLTDYQILKAAEKHYGSKKAVATELGVSPRHVQRMMRQARTSGGRMRTSTDLRGRIQDMYGRPQVRQAMSAPRRARTMSTTGAHVTMSGTLGPEISGHDPDEYKRLREMGWHISPEGMEHIREAWLTGDPEHAQEVAREIIGQEYGVSDWNWNDDSDFSMSFRY